MKGKSTPNKKNHFAHRRMTAQAVLLEKLRNKVKVRKEQTHSFSEVYFMCNMKQHSYIDHYLTFLLDKLYIMTYYTMLKIFMRHDM